jgi:lipopolysaccharide transport system ATP-binding protein
MNDAVVTFDRVSKKFRRGERHDSLRDLIPALARRLMAGAQEDGLDREEFWAVKDVSFEVRPGEALGIIGSNGAGKSTTLKLLTKILKPTRGGCHVHGRVGALIEIAAGFHPDLTGRENIFLQGAIMGMKRPEIARVFDDIVEFAGVEQFIDTPVKRYSSGMNARLGFSIAAHIHPEVLLIDEVLSVGDTAFQRRCEERMKTFLAGGVAVVFVSHNLRMVAELCTKAIWLESGTVAAAGPAGDTVAAYCSSEGARSLGDGARVALQVQSAAREDFRVVNPGERIRLTADVEFLQDVEHATVGIVIWEITRNLYVYGASSDAVGIPPIRARAGDRRSLDFSLMLNLTRGAYAIEVNVVDVDQQKHLARLMPAKQFTVTENISYNGVANLYLEAIERPCYMAVS